MKAVAIGAVSEHAMHRRSVVGPWRLFYASIYLAPRIPP